MSKSNNDRGFTGSMSDAALPVGGTLPGGGFDEDFLKTLGVVPGTDVPPLHPGKRTEITDEEYAEAMAKKQDPATLMANTRFRSEYYQFSLDVPEECTKLQSVVDNCLQKGWVMAREDWHRTQEGNTIIAMKCLVPLTKKKRIEKGEE